MAGNSQLSGSTLGATDADAPGSPNIFDLIEKSVARMPDSIRFVGLWLAMIDGELDPREFHEISLAMEHEPEGVGFDAMSAALSTNYAPAQAISRDLLRVFRFLRANRSLRKSEFLLDFFIRICAADGGISQSERHALLFLSDLLALPSETLADRFDALLGIEFEPPEDLSTSGPYERVEAEIKARHERLRDAGLGAEIDEAVKAKAAASVQSSVQTSFERVLTQAQRDAFLCLGLKQDANPIQIKAAWRKLSQKNHPDRFAQADEAAVQTATEVFRNIQNAFDVLVEAFGRA